MIVVLVPVNSEGIYIDICLHFSRWEIGLAGGKQEKSPSINYEIYMVDTFV